MNIKKQIFEKYKNLNPDFEQNCDSKTAKSGYEIAHDCIGLSIWMDFFKRLNDYINYCD